MVFRTAYRITGNAADAEDVLQTVFLRLLRREPGTSAVDSYESYLRRSAVNAALDIVRSGRDWKNVPLDDLSPGPATSLPGGKETESRELREQLRRALARLQPREAEIFALRFFEERSNQEIARMLGISQVHVAVILHRTRGLLQKEISSYLGEKR
jgi:RNA polymerase sigma-70 factor (ECF subfamily)